MNDQILTLNLHRPRIQDHQVQPSGTVVIGLGNGMYHGTVEVFFESLDTLKAFISGLEVKVAEIEAADMVEDRPTASELESVL